MLAEQRFFNTDPDYLPRIYGYSSGLEAEKKANHIRAYLSFRLNCGHLEGLKYMGMEEEKKSIRQREIPFLHRYSVKELLGIIQPGDHLVVSTSSDIFRSWEEAGSVIRYLVEHGIRLHVIDFHGTYLDTGSISGMAMASLFGLYQSLGEEIRSERAIIGRSKIRARGRWGGTGVPFFCKAIGNPKRTFKRRHKILVFKRWALPAMEMMQRLVVTEGLPVSRAAELTRTHIFEEFGDKLKYVSRDKLAGSTQQFRRMHFFHLAWLELGQPNINELNFTTVTDEYLLRQEKRNGTPNVQ